MDSTAKIQAILTKWISHNEGESHGEFLLEFVDEFVSIYGEYLHPVSDHLFDSSESPHLTQLPVSLLDQLGPLYRQCVRQFMAETSAGSVKQVISLLKCLIIICRNHDNVIFVASCDFVNHSTSVAQAAINKLSHDQRQKPDPEFLCNLTELVTLVLQLFECMYDPNFCWRKHLKWCLSESDAFSASPALLHNEVIPFVHECFQKPGLSGQLQLDLLHTFGAIMSGSLTNASLSITPAVMDVLLNVLSGTAKCCVPRGADHWLEIGQLVVKCVVTMVRTSSRASQEQRQMEVGEIMSSYMQVFLVMAETGPGVEILSFMADGIKEMTRSAAHRSSLQTQLATDVVLQGLVSILQKSSVSYSDSKGCCVQTLALSVVAALESLLRGSSHAKVMFEKCVGHQRFFEVLSKCGELSMDLLQSLVSLVLESQGSSVIRTTTIKNVTAAVCLMHCVGMLQTPDLQIWLSDEMRRLCCSSYRNRIACCQGGMISALLTLLSQHSRLQVKAIGQIISMLEKLGSVSITAAELKQLIGLMKTGDDGKPYPYTSQLIRAMSAMARREGIFPPPRYFFDIQHLSDVINLPGIHKWPGPAFSFFCLFCLDKECSLESVEGLTSFAPYRRLLYNFSTSIGSGFEAFIIPTLNLTVATFNKKEFNTVTVTDVTLDDGLWHSLCVVHTAGRRFSSSPGHVQIYLDGKLKANVVFKCPSLSEPFTSCRVGSPGTSSHVDIISDSPSRLPQHKKTLPLKSLFHLPVSRSSDSSSSSKLLVHTLESGTQEDTWGSAVCFHGQLESVCVFQDVLQPEQVKVLSQRGVSSIFHALEDPELSDLPAKLIARYTAKTCRDHVCMDLSPMQNHGIFSGNQCVSWDIRDVINCLGGIQLLFPILENLDQSLTEMPDLDTPVSTPSPTTEDLDDLDKSGWALVSNTVSASAEKELEHNQLAAFITLVRCMLKEKPVNKDVFVRTSCAATLAMLMMKVHKDLMDVNVLMAVQHLVEECDDHLPVKSLLLQHIYHFILFNFSLWSKTQFAVRIGHIQYLSTIIKDDRKYFRKKYGVQFFLDVIRSFYVNKYASGLSEDDSRTIRVSLLNLVKFYISNNIQAAELSHLMGFMLAVRETALLLEAIDLFISLLENRSRKQDQLILLLYEPDQAEMFYKLLTYPHQPLIFYEKVVKILYLCLKSERVYDKSKSRLRLLDVGHWGLVNLMTSYSISAPMIRYFLQQVSLSADIPQTYGAVLAVLGLVHNCGLDIKSVASQQLLSIVVSKPSAAKGFARQLGWQENITRLLTLERKNYTDNSSPPTGLDNNINTKRQSVGKDLQQPLSELHLYSMAQARTENSFVVKEDNWNQLPSHDSPSAIALYEKRSLHDSEILESEESGFLPGSQSSSSTSVEDLPLDSSFTSSSHQSDISSNLSLTFEDDSDLGSNQRSGCTLRPSASLGDFDQLDDVLKNMDDRNIYECDESRRGSSVLPEEVGLKQVLKQAGVELSDTLEQKEELCQNLLIVLQTITWKGVEGSSTDVWKERGQVFAWIDELGESHNLIRPPEEIKRRLMEMLLHNCSTDVRSSTGQTIAAETENAIRLIQLVQGFVTEPGAPTSRFSIRLLEDMMSLLDALGVLDMAGMLSWAEMVHRAFSVLLAFCEQSALDLVSAATVKLHSLIQSKFVSTSAEAAYILGALNTLILRAIDEESDSYSYFMPVMKALLDHSQELLNINTHLPGLPKSSTSPSFYDDFRLYVHTEEWQKFITNYIGPQLTHFIENSFEEGSRWFTDFWASCHEQMMMSHHRHNREIGESRLKFRSQIEDTYKKKVEQENRRFFNTQSHQRNQLLFAQRQWRANKRFFTGERGAWQAKEQLVHWKLSNQENFARMKLKLTQNYNFDDHSTASQMRDNVGVSDNSNYLKLEELKKVKEALVSKEEIADDVLGDEEWSAIAASSASLEEATGKEKLVIAADCELITVVDDIRGRLEVTTTHVYFFDLNPFREEAGEDFKWSLSRLREIHFRRYNLRRSALEVFLIDQTNYFINFPEKGMRNKIYSRILSLRPPNLIYKGQRSPGDLLRASGLMQKWVNREISNFEYLMQLNTIAGRSYNDLSQYPVFPWILMDYTSQNLDLENPSVFRDLSKPIGVVNPRNEAEVRDKYDTFEDPSGMIEKFHYGTHYSNAASVMHYLVRVEPFTTLHIQLQSGKFDVADRQFYTIPGSFASLMENPNDVKELIPEFFYFPEFLVNFNGFDLGKLQATKHEVNDVILPAWASSPEEFIHKHRQALESEHVSVNLHHWIDLIFGYKQKGPAAVEALNVFYYVTYEGAVDLDAIQDAHERASIEGMIRNFGQTPSQLLKEPHPKRLSFAEAVARNSKSGKPMSVFHFIQSLKPFFVEISSDRDPVVFVTVPKNQTRSILQQGMPDCLVTLTEEGVIGVHGWLPFDKAIPNFYTFERDATMSNPRLKKQVKGPFFPGLKVTSKLFVVSHDAKLLFSGGFWDNSIQVYSLSRPKMISHVVRHIDVVTCLALDSCGRHLVSGSRDTTCMIWEIIQQSGASVGLNPKPLQTLYGHDSEVTAVHVSTELDLVVSASKDGTVILHTVLKGNYTMTLRVPYTEGWKLDIPNMVVSDMGQIVLYCVEVARTTGEAQQKHQEKHSLHLYSVNGKHLYQEGLQHGLNDLCVAREHLLLGNNTGQLIIMEIFRLRAVTTMELLVPIQCLAMTNLNSHVLAGLRDGKLIIVGHK